MTAKKEAVRIPPMLAVQSSSISHIGHDGAGLFVRFKRGALYRYADVPVEKYVALRKADSIGKHLQVEIMRHFSGVVVPEPEPEEKKD